MTKAVFFDVDFTLIYPGPTFQAEGYRRACAAHGIDVDPARFDAATAASSVILDDVEEQIYTHDLFVHYTASIIEHMGGRGEQVIVGAISNSHRSLDAFCEHFSLGGLITVSVSSAEHGYMKPHRSIFDAALAKAGVRPEEAVMVGDSIKHDIDGALAIGMRAVLLRRSGEVPADLPAGLPVIHTLTVLPSVI